MEGLGRSLRPLCGRSLLEVPYHPEQEGRLALYGQEFGLDGEVVTIAAPTPPGASATFSSVS
jgi:hypothetical protein